LFIKKAAATQFVETIRNLRVDSVSQATKPEYVGMINVTIALGGLR
jgi:hypothetical protein